MIILIAQLKTKRLNPRYPRGPGRSLAMKGLLVLSLIGAGIYGALVVSHDLLRSDKPQGLFAEESLGDPGARQLRSWGSDLPALVTSQPASVLLRKPDATASSSENGQAPAADVGLLPVAQAKSIPAQSASTTYPTGEWTKVALAARVHSDASVSSPIISFYQAGTALQVLDRQNGWVQVADRASGESGWVFEQYLAPATGPTVTHTALETSASKPVAEPARANLVPGAKKRVRAPRPAVRMPEDVAMAQFERRWERRAERRGGFGFFFGRFARNEAEFR
jgi:Bacterial SH3 domain